MESAFKALTIQGVAPTSQTGRSVGLLSLPTELLDRIVGHLYCLHDELSFTFNRRTVFHDDEDEPEILSVYRLRLTCKRLCEVASRLFMPVLRICLSEASLNRAEEIIKHARASQSIRGIELLLEYRPDNMAADFETFFEFRTSNLADLQETWEEAKVEAVLENYEGWTPAELDAEANRIFTTQIKDVPFPEDTSFEFYYPLYQHVALAYER